MLQELKFQLSTAILTILTLAASVGAVTNFWQYQRFHLADDGVVWVDRNGGVEAADVARDSSGAKAVIHKGDRLERIAGYEIHRALDVPQVLARIGTWQKTTYIVSRDGVPVPHNVLVGEAKKNSAVFFLDALGATYLLIGLFVYFRRGSAQKAQHFYILCLVSFVAFSFHYTGNLDAFDQLVYFANVAAGLFAPTIFLHFCLTFPERRKWFQQPFQVVLLYLPAVLLTSLYLAVSTGALKTGIPQIDLRWLLDRPWTLLPTALYLLGAYALNIEYRKAEDPIMRQQLKWLRNGAVCGAGPYALFYVLPYSLGAIPGYYQALSVLSMVLIPLTLAYAIVRYRLMDVDILFRRGYAYTLATLLVLVSFYGIVFTLGNVVSQKLKFTDPNNVVGLMVMLTAAFLFHFALKRVGLALFVERHHHDRRAISAHQPGLAQEFLLAFLHRDRVDDRLALDAFEPGFDHRELRRIDHHRHARDIGLGGDEVEELDHHRLRVDEALVHIDVDDLRPVRHLVARDDERAGIVAGRDRACGTWPSR